MDRGTTGNASAKGQPSPLINLRSLILQKEGKSAKSIRPIYDDMRTLYDIAKEIPLLPESSRPYGNFDGSTCTREIGICLPYLGMRFAAQHFGIEGVLLVLQAYDGYTSIGKALREEIRKNRRIDMDLFDYARKVNSLNPIKTGTFAQNDQFQRLCYFALDIVTKQPIAPPDIEIILQANTRDGIQLTPETIGTYSLETLIPTMPHHRHPYWGWRIPKSNISYNIFIDGLFGIALLHKGRPQAVVSLAPEDTNTITISQLQGIKPLLLKGIKEDTPHDQVPRGTPIGLFPLRMKDLLLDIAVRTARTVGMTRLGIQSGENNHWTKVHPQDGKIHLPAEKAVAIYDRFAQEKGFTQDPSTKNWYLRLDTPACGYPPSF